MAAGTFASQVLMRLAHFNLELSLVTKIDDQVRSQDQPDVLTTRLHTNLDATTARHMLTLT